MELAQFDWSLYWFMFPVAICVAATAMFCGIGGAALFAPIFMIAFPLLGPEYPFPNIVAAIGVAVLTATFGASSGFVGYWRKRLIDFRSAVPYILIGVPLAVLGAVLLAGLKEYEEFLRASYAVLMFALAGVLFRRERAAAGSVPPHDSGTAVRAGERHIVGRDGIEYRFPVPKLGRGIFTTGLGGFLTGLMGVGIGETVMPHLVKLNRVPVPVAAATSVFILIVVIASASVTQISTLVAAGGFAAVPWNVVVYTVPGVIIGGQIGPRLQGRVPQRAVSAFIGALFVAIGAAMGFIALRNSVFG